MSNSSSEPEQHRHEASAKDMAPEEILRKASTWSWGIGHRTIRWTIYPITIATIFGTLIVAFLISGIVLTVLGIQASTLGGPLIVGALFALGAFVGQFWAVAHQRYRDAINSVPENQLDALDKVVKELEAIHKLMKERVT
jgi:hypothetical protein